MIAIGVEELVCKMRDGRGKLFEGRVPSRVTQVLPMTKRRSRAGAAVGHYGARTAASLGGVALSIREMHKPYLRISPHSSDQQPRQNHTALIPGI
jgi:hypothetical protein